MKKLLYILLLIASIVQGQDVHFSQFNQTPLIINPALTGSGLGNHRAGLNYREQGTFFTKGYVTQSVFYDGKYSFTSKRARNIRDDYFGLGLIFINDRAGDSRMGVTQIGLSVAYFKELIENHIFSIGFQGAFGQRSIDFTNLTWGSQYSNNYYNADIPPEYITGGENFTFPDVTTGITWKYEKDRYLNTRLGASFHHVNSVKLKYLDVENEILDRKLIIHGEIYYMLRRTVVTFIPSFLYERQGKVQEGIYGMLLKLQVSETNYSSKLMENWIGFGAYHRYKDSFILTLVVSSKNTRIGFNYDFNTSSLSRASNYKGAIEVSLTFHIPYEKRRGGNTLL